MTTKWTKEERLELFKMKEDYLEFLHTKPHVRDSNPELWHTVVDQWESIKNTLDEDEYAKCLDTAYGGADEVEG